MSKSLIYAVNSNTQTVTSTTSTTINFGSAVRRYGCGINISGGNVEITSEGYFNIDTNITFTPTGAGTVIIQLYKDGIAIPGAISSVEVAAASINTFTIPTTIRQKCGCESTITATISGVVGTIDNATIRVVKD